MAAGAGLAQNTTGWKGQMEGYLDKIVDGTSRGYLTKGKRIPDSVVLVLIDSSLQAACFTLKAIPTRRA